MSKDNLLYIGYVQISDTGNIYALNLDGEWKTIATFSIYQCPDCGWIFRTENDKANISCFVCGQRMEYK